MTTSAQRRSHARHRAATPRSRQLDLFIAERETPLVGLGVKLDRPVDRDRACCGNIFIIGPGKGPHAGELSCADCGQHRGWISNATAYWIESVVARFGTPATPISVRKSHTHEEEVPAQKN